jgi:hypothetical protein
LVASCFLGALPPVDLRAVCLVRAMAIDDWIEIRENIRDFVDLFYVWGK